MIESARFVNVNGSVVNFNDNNIPFSEFSTTVDMRMSEREKSQQHGLYPSNTYMGKRLFNTNGDLLALDSADYWVRRLAMVGALMPRPHLDRKAGDLFIQFTGVPEELSSECTLDGYPELPLAALSPSASKWQVNFKSFDPRLYGVYRNVDLLYGVSDNLGGRTFNKTYPYSYATAATSPSTAIISQGAYANMETFPRVTFYGPVTNPRITFQRSDGQVFFMTLTGLTLTDISDTAVVDFLTRTAIRGNGANLYNYTVGSDWYALEPLPLTTTVQYSGSAGSSPSHAVVAWRNAYMI